MIKSYYIQKGTDPYKDIWVDYGIIVMKTQGLYQLPKAKKPFYRSWPDEQGDDTYLPTDAKFETKDVTLTFRIQKDTVDDIRTAYKSFYKYLIGGGEISYFDTLKKEGFRGYYTENKINSENYRLTGSHLEFEMDFTCPNGICFGFDNSSGSSIFVNVLSGYGDIYFSDGSSVLNATVNFTKNLVGGFVIVCPSVLEGVEILPRINKLIGTNTGKLITTRTGKLIVI